MNREPCMPFIVRGIPRALADEARRTLVSPGYGHPAHVEVAGGTGPCRCCLRPFTPGVDRRLLFTYRPPNRDDTLMAPGPVFVHAEGCDPWDGEGFPGELLALPMVLEARAPNGRVLGLVSVEPGSVSRQIDASFADGAAWLHVRHAIAGCFIATVEKKGPAVARGA